MSTKEVYAFRLYPHLWHLVSNRHTRVSMDAHERQNISILIDTYRLWKLRTTASISHCQITILCSLNRHRGSRSKSIESTFWLNSCKRYHRRAIWYVNHVCSSWHSNSCWNRIYKRWGENFGSWVELKFLKECHDEKKLKVYQQLNKKNHIISNLALAIYYAAT